MKKKKLAADSKVDVMMFEPHNMKVSGGKKKNKKSRDEKRTKSKVGRMEVEEFDTFHVDKVGLAEGKLQRKKKGKNIENIDKADECNGKDGASEKQHGKPKKAAKMKKKKQLVANDNYSDIFMEKKGEENEGDDAEDEVYKMSSGDEDYSKEGNSYRGSKEEKEDKMNKKLAADSKVDAKMFGPHNMKAYETLEVSGGKNKRKKSSDKKRTKSRVARMGVEEFKSCHMDKVEQAEGKLQKLRKKIRKNVQNIDEVEECNGKDGASEQQNDSKPEDHITNSGLLNKDDSRRNSKTGKLERAVKMKKKKQLVLSDISSDIFLGKKGEEKGGGDAEDEIYQMSSGDEDYSKGMKKWITDYYQRRPGLKVLQERIDDFIIDHEAKEQQATAEREVQAAEGGWTVVVHHKGRKKTTDAESGIAVGSVAQAAVVDKMRTKKKKEVGLDFYRFQKREAHRNEVMMLQNKFEQDKKRIQQMRAARKFRPY